MDLSKLKEVNILGYNGNWLALIFETLTANFFKGKINIFMHDKIKRCDNNFETNIKYKIFHYSEVNLPPNNAFVICSNVTSRKEKLFQFFQKRWNISEDQMLSLIHPSSIIASSVKPNPGFYMEPLSAISAYSKIGYCVTINRNCSIGHHNILHDFCSIDPGSNLSGNVEVGRASTVGPGCTVFYGVKIGKNSVIGGGSVVTKDIPDEVLAFGNPCRIVKNNPYI